jgi:outer membrane protein OmpA-like peptidoglycan-associated protein
MRLAFLILLLPCFAAAQADTLVYAEGKITNAVTKEPITAKVSYQSLPYGSKVGFLSGTSFSFPLYDNEKYSIEVTAPGFEPAKYMLDPAEANGNRRVIRDIELKLPGHAGDSVAHHAGKVLRLNILFEPNKWNILPTSFTELDNLAATMRTNPRMVIQLEGHTDPQGDPKKQMKLSKDRVESAKKYLILKGISGSRIRTKAFGGTQPLSNANTGEAHRLNRRVEMRVLEN